MENEDYEVVKLDEKSQLVGIALGNGEYKAYVIDIITGEKISDYFHLPSGRIINEENQ